MSSMYDSSGSRMIERIRPSASGGESGIWFLNSSWSRVDVCVALSDDAGGSSSRWYIMIWQADSKSEYQRGPTAMSGTPA